MHHTNRKSRKQHCRASFFCAPETGQGFSLIELMMVLAVIAILTMVSVPQYTSYVQRGNRAAAQQHMLDVSGALEMYRMDRRQYPTAIGTGATELDYDTPSEVSNHYVLNYTVNNAATPPRFLLTATPLAGGTQASDGALTLSSAGIKTPSDKW